MNNKEFANRPDRDPSYVKRIVDERLLRAANQPNASVVEAFLKRGGRANADRSSSAALEFLANLKAHTIVEDDSLLVINKPPGISTHHNAVVSCGAEELIRYARRDAKETIVSGHRLDKDTSGVLVLAKTEPALASLISQFSNKENSKMDKLYLALLDGEFTDPIPQEVRVLLADLKLRKVRVVDPVREEVPENAKLAISHFAPMTLFADKADPSRRITLSSVKILTGRTHQIRVTAAHLGLPVVGDGLYNLDNPNPDGVTRQMLHALRLTLAHPQTHEELTLVAPPPQDFNRMVSRNLNPIRNYGTGATS